MEDNHNDGNMDKFNDFESRSREDIFSKSVRAGRRTYFFDVKATRRGEYYLTLTESIKKIGNDGRFHFEKHKIFLYKEDFDNFIDNLQETLDYIKANNVDFEDDEPKKTESESEDEK